MDFTFQNMIDLVANNIFAGSTTLAGLAIMLAIWAVCAVICLAMRAPPVYTVVPLIPISIFFTSYGLLNKTIMVVIVLISSVLVAAEFKKVVN